MSFNGRSWQTSSSGAYWELGVGVTFNFGGVGKPPKEKR